MDTNFHNLPITALCILADRNKCPVRYIAVDKGYDTVTEIDLWKDGLFARKTNRFICFTKEYPINNSYNVIEDIKLFNERENVPHGYMPFDKTEDTFEKAFQRKVLYAKVGPRYLTNEAISDIILLGKSKKAPSGYICVGDINNVTLCVKYSKINNENEKRPISERITSAGPQYPQQTPPPLPPRPTNGQEAPGLPRQNSDFYKTVQRIYDSADSYNPLLGVPFELNPIYARKLNSQESFDTDIIDKYAKPGDLLRKFEYDFNLELSIYNKEA